MNMGRLSTVLWLSVVCLLLPLGSSAVVITNDVSGNTVWTLAGSPYTICKFDFRVKTNCTLIIEEGVTVGMGNRGSGTWTAGDDVVMRSFTVDGELIATGVHFTSFATYAGPDYGYPNTADWEVVTFHHNSTGRLTDCLFEYGGAGAVTYGQVRIMGELDLIFDGCTFRYADNDGLYYEGTTGGNVLLRDCIFTNLAIGVNTHRNEGGDIIIDNCVFNDLYSMGVWLRNSNALIRNCTFDNVVDVDINLWESWVDNWWCDNAVICSNQLTGGNKNAFPIQMFSACNYQGWANQVSGYRATNTGVSVTGTIPKDRDVIWGTNDLPYLINNGVRIDADVSGCGRLTVSPGSRIWFYRDADNLRSHGDLRLQGTASAPILFSGQYTNRTGFGLQFDNYWGTSEVQYCIFNNIRQGASFQSFMTNSAYVNIHDCIFSNIQGKAFTAGMGWFVPPLPFKDCLIDNCAEVLDFNQTFFWMENVDIQQSGILDFYQSGGGFTNCNIINLSSEIYAEDSELSFDHCTIAGNRGYGINDWRGGNTMTFTDSIMWGNKRGSFYSGSAYTANYCCIDNLSGTWGSNNLAEPPQFRGWVSGTNLLYVDAAGSGSASGTQADPYIHLYDAIDCIHSNYDYALASGSPCIGAGSSGGNMGAANGTGSQGVDAFTINITTGTYTMADRGLALRCSLHGDGADAVYITNTIYGLRNDALLEGLCVKQTGGRGIDLLPGNNPTIHACAIQQLTYEGIVGIGCAPTVTYTRVSHILFDAISLSGSNIPPVIRNCLIYDTGGIYLMNYTTGVIIQSSTVYSNTSYGIELDLAAASTSHIENTIIYGNELDDIYMDGDGHVVVDHCNYDSFDGSWKATITNRVLVEPVFEDPSLWNLHPVPGSYSINAGNNQSWMSGGVDFDGTQRILNSVVDIGAYETLIDSPLIRVSNTSVYVYAPLQGPAPNAETVTVQNAGIGTLNYTLSETSSWFSVSPGSGSSTGEKDAIDIYFNTTSLPAGHHYGNITITDAAASNSPIEVPVEVFVLKPTLVPVPIRLDVATSYGHSPTDSSFRVVNGVSGSTLHYTITNNIPWCSLSSYSGISTGNYNTVTVYFATSELPVGSYSEYIYLYSPDALSSPKSVRIDLDVTSAVPYMVCSPTNINVLAQLGEVPDDQDFWVHNTGDGIMNYVITTNVSWLQVSPGSGDNSGEYDYITLHYLTAGLSVGLYTGVVTVSSAEATNSSVDIIVQVYVVDIASALKYALNGDLSWSTDGDAVWFPQTNTTHDGESAAQSGDIGNYDATWIESTIHGPGILSFWWKVDSEGGYDYLKFYTNGTFVTQISGDVDWQQRTYEFDGGMNVLKWSYDKDSSSSVGEDAGWLDEVYFTLVELPDSDTNGLPDYWELKYFGSITGALPSADSDLDGYNNREEYLADTNPTNTASHFPLITNVMGYSECQVGISPTSTGRIYSLLSSSNMIMQSWNSFGPTVYGTGSNLIFRYTNEVDIRFYRTGVTLP